MKFAVVGATGLVGGEVLKVLEERRFPLETLVPVASEQSVGKQVSCFGKSFSVVDMDTALALKPALAIFSAGGATSLEHAPKFAQAGTFVIDNSSAWRMHPKHRLIVPEINAHLLEKNDKIIANPNCSTIQMVLALAPLHRQYGIKRIVVSTYQSVTGTGKAAVTQLMDERAAKAGKKAYPHPIDLNIIPHIDIFLENGYTKEEMKMVNETKKIFGDESIQVTATAVRVPTIGGHAEAINVSFLRDFDLETVRRLLAEAPGVVVTDNPAQNEYPMPLHAHGKDDTFVGRIRRDDSQENTLNLWVVADNLRKGAATNAVQIAEYLTEKFL